LHDPDRKTSASCGAARRLSGTSALLLTEAAALAIAKGRWTRDEACEHFAFSKPMLQFRLNATGAAKRCPWQSTHPLVDR
jgi:hypothetical protein